MVKLNWDKAPVSNENVNVKLNLKGSRRLDFVPAGKTTEVKLSRTVVGSELRRRVSSGHTRNHREWIHRLLESITFQPSVLSTMDSKQPDTQWR